MLCNEVLGHSFDVREADFDMLTVWIHLFNEKREDAQHFKL